MPNVTAAVVSVILPWMATVSPRGAAETSGYYRAPGGGGSQDRAGGSCRGFTFGIGVAYTNFGDAGPIEQDGLELTGFQIDTSGLDLVLTGEVTLLPWLAAGGSYARVSALSRDQTFDVVGFRDFTAEIRGGTLDPWLAELYAMPGWRVHPAIRVFGTIGVAYWRAHSEDTVVLMFQGIELDRETVVDDSSGTGLVVGAGFDLWPHRRIGVRVGYRYLRLEDGSDVDAALNNVLVMALTRF